MVRTVTYYSDVVKPTLSWLDLDAVGFGERQREIRTARDLSQQKLSYAMRDADAEEGRGYDASFIARVERGDRAAPPRYTALLMKVLAPTLDEFPELYLAEARRQLDEREVGFDEAMATLRRFVGAEAGTPDLELPGSLDPDSIRRALESPSAGGAGSPGSAKAASPRSKRRAKRRAA
jgi:transcriptional regulator with XRE-family HTH domain